MSGKKEYVSAKAVIKEFLVSLLGVLLLGWIVYAGIVYVSVWTASSQVYLNPQQEYLRVRIYGSSSSPEGNTISAAFSIVDTNGNEITAIERSWSGNYLAVEFAEADFSSSYYLFPSKIYGKERIMEAKPDRNKSTNLEKYYNENHQCMLLGFGSTFEERNNLYKIARFATKKLFVPGFGRISSYQIDLSGCKMNTWYSIQRTAEGDLIIQEI